MASRETLLQWSFVSLVVGGVLILAGGLMGLLMVTFADGFDLMGMERAAPGLLFGGMVAWMLVWAVLTGGVVLAAAWRVHVAPETASTWGIVAIIAGALSLLGMGGYFVGAVAAVAGGALALMASTREPQAITARRA